MICFDHDVKMFYIPHEWNPFLAINVIFDKWCSVPDVPTGLTG